MFRYIFFLDHEAISRNPFSFQNSCYSKVYKATFVEKAHAHQIVESGNDAWTFAGEKIEVSSRQIMRREIRTYVSLPKKSCNSKFHEKWKLRVEENRVMAHRSKKRTDPPFAHYASLFHFRAHTDWSIQNQFGQNLHQNTLSKIPQKSLNLGVQKKSKVWE